MLDKTKKHLYARILFLEWKGGKKESSICCVSASQLVNGTVNLPENQTKETEVQTPAKLRISIIDTLDHHVQISFLPRMTGGGGDTYSWYCEDL